MVFNLTDMKLSGGGITIGKKRRLSSKALILSFLTFNRSKEARKC